MSHDESALVPSNYSQLPRQAKKTKDSTFDRIYKYYHNKLTRIELTPEEINLRERWEKAWLLLCRRRTKKQVVELITKLFNVEQSVAYDDVNKSMMLFTDPREDLKGGKREIAETNFLQGADKAWKSGNLELHLKYMKEYVEINKLNEQGASGSELADLVKKMKPHTIMIVSKKEDLEAEAQKLNEDLAKDIEFTEVDETENSKD